MDVELLDPSGNLIASADNTQGGTGNVVTLAGVSLPADGTYEVVAVATDNLTNSSTSASTLLTVDSTPPTVSMPSVNGFS